MVPDTDTIEHQQPTPDTPPAKPASTTRPDPAQTNIEDRLVVLMLSLVYAGAAINFAVEEGYRCAYEELFPVLSPPDTTIGPLKRREMVMAVILQASQRAGLTPKQQMEFGEA